MKHMILSFKMKGNIISNHILIYGSKKIPLSLPTKQGKWPLLCTGCLTTHTCYDATLTFSMHWQNRFRKPSHTGNKCQRKSLIFSKSFPAKSRWMVEYLIYVCCCCLHTWYLSRAHKRGSCNFFLAGVNFYRFNAKNWQFTV